VTAPTVSELPELPTFPSGPGLPDQPGVFIPQFLAFLAALRVFRDEINALAAYIAGLGGAGGDPDPVVVSGSLRWSILNTDADSHTITGDDIGRHLRFTNDDAAELFISLETVHGFSAGERLRVTQIGDGQVVVNPSSPSITINSLNGANVSIGRGAEFELEYVGSNEWDCFGDIESEPILLSGDMSDDDSLVLLSGDMADGENEALSGV
jgi:hypothetical protein